MSTLGTASVAHTLGYALRLRNPALAQALSPSDARIVALSAEKMLTAEASPTDRAHAVQLAARALRRDPTTVASAAVIGFAAGLDEDPTRAKHAFGYSQRLSRRDLRSHVWQIEDKVARGDIAGALRHYDMALRTSLEAPNLLYPVLAAASAEPAVATALARTLVARPSWGASFLNYAAGSAPDPRAAARLFLMLHRADIAPSAAARAVTVTRLIAHGALDQAWEFYGATGGSRDRRRSRDPDFENDGADPTILDWVPGAEDAITATIERRDAGGVLAFAVPVGMGGVIVRQAQLLPPGAYRLDGRSARVDQPADARPYWQLSCGDGRELGRIALPASADRGGRFTGLLQVPTGCPTQVLALVARPSDLTGGVTGEIDRAQLAPAQ